VVVHRGHELEDGVPADLVLLAFEGAEGATLDDRDVIAVKLVLREELPNLLAERVRVTIRVTVGKSRQERTGHGRRERWQSVGGENDSGNHKKLLSNGASASDTVVA